MHITPFPIAAAICALTVGSPAPAAQAAESSQQAGEARSGRAAAAAQVDAVREQPVTAGEMELAELAASALALQQRLGRIATVSAESDEVKAFGNAAMLLATQARPILERVLHDTGMSMPEGMLARHAAVAESLSELGGSAFDRAFMEGMVATLDHLAGEYERAAGGDAGPELRAFAGAMASVSTRTRDWAREIERGL